MKARTVSGTASRAKQPASRKTPLKQARVDLLAAESKDITPKTPNELARSLKALLQTNRRRRLFGVLCVHVDACATVHSRLGAAARDALLLEAYRRLTICVRKTDVVAKGEDGMFLILATELQSEDELAIIFNRIHNTCREPYSLFGKTASSELTTGAAATAGDQAPAELVQRAVTAMKAAARQQRPYQLAEMQAPRPSTVGEPAAAEELFRLTYLPQFGPAGNLLGARVVVELPRVRPANNKGGELAAKQERVDDLVLRQALKAAQTWRARGLEAPMLSLETEAGQILSPSFGKTLLAMLREHDLPSSALELLLTEQTVQTCMERGSETIAMLEAAGVRFGLSGFSVSLGTRLDLRKLSFASLRVSCKGLFTVTSADESVWLTRSVVAVARRCGLTFVGEDVETASQRDVLLASGCERFEGPLLSPAVSALDFEHLLTPA